MAYVFCMPARIAAMTHRLDNVVEGELEVEGERIPFRTRGHVVKAVNRHYRGSSWKPSRGADVLVDGDRGADGLVVDHIEADRIHDGGEANHPHLDAIAGIIERRAPSREIRVWRGAKGLRVRFASAASRRTPRGRIEEELIHAERDAAGGAWRILAIRRSDGEVAARGIDPAVGVILARAAGRELLAGETEAERDRREQAEIRIARDEARRAPPPPPPDPDCPF